MTETNVVQIGGQWFVIVSHPESDGYRVRCADRAAAECEAARIKRG